MALEDDGYVLINRTVLYDAPVDTPAPGPTELDNPPAPWTILGHVGDETGDGNVSFTRDGGEVTTKGSMTKRAIRQVVEPVISGIDVDVTQFTRNVIALYTGTDGGSTTGVFHVEGASDGGVTERASLTVWEDGDIRVALYAPRAGWTGREAIEPTSIEDAVRIPLHAGFLDSETLTGSTGKPLRYDWISPDLMATS